MRKLFISEMVSLDGFFAGPNGELDWHNVDAQFNNEYAIPMLDSVDTLLFGKITYELMMAYWPTQSAMKDDPLVAEKMNNLNKIVFSKTMKKVEETNSWKNIHLVKNNISGEIQKLKKETGKEMVILGSGQIVQYCMNNNLIDEYRLMVSPIILGKGKQLFANIATQHSLHLVDTKKFSNGNILLIYTPISH